MPRARSINPRTRWCVAHVSVALILDVEQLLNDARLDGNEDGTTREHVAEFVEKYKAKLGIGADDE